MSQSDLKNCYVPYDFFNINISILRRSNVAWQFYDVPYMSNRFLFLSLDSNFKIWQSCVVQFRGHLLTCHNVTFSR